MVWMVVLLGVAGCGGETTREDGPPATTPDVATFSIVARDPETGDLGVAVQSRFFGVGAVVPYVRADVGAVATQALAAPHYGFEGLSILDVYGLTSSELIDRVTAADPGRDRRQVGVVDWRGEAAVFTGAKTLPWSGHVVGDGYCCLGNILAGEKVVKAMAAAYEQTEASFPERLVAALAAGQAAGGDKRGKQSAALKIARRQGGYRAENDRWIDIRVDDHPAPIRELGRLLKLRMRSLPSAPVPVQIEGLVRDGMFLPDGPGQTTRYALMLEFDELPAGFQYVGSVIKEDGATAYYTVRATRALQSMEFVRHKDKGWKAARSDR